MPAFLAQWKKIKTDYEAATDRKKPSDTFMGVFKGKTGLDTGFTALDAALKKADLKVAQKAQETLEKSAMAYRRVLVKAAVAEKNKDIQKETNKMMDKLEELVDSSQLSIRDAGQVPSVASLREFSALMRTPAFDRVEAFANKTHRTESMNFLIAMVEKDYSAATFTKYIKGNDVNIADKTIAGFDEADLRNAPWDAATREVLVLFRQNIIKPLNSLIAS